MFAQNGTKLTFFKRDYNYSTSLLTNQQASAKAWNSHYGFPQGFNPYATPGYGWTYPQWLQQAMEI